MPADLVADLAIPHLAAQVSPAMRRTLQHLQERGFIQKGPDLERLMAVVLKQLAGLGLVDPGYGPTNGEPFIWVSNSNGERVLEHLAKTGENTGLHLTIHPRAETALASLPDSKQIDILVAAESLLGRDPAAWSPEEATRLEPGKPIFLLRVSPEWRAFVKVEADGRIELFDIAREDTLRLFLERYSLGSSAR